jgi:hypothetical protein
VVRVWVGSRVLRRSSSGRSRLLSSCAGRFFGVLGVVIRRLIVDMVSFQDEIWWLVGCITDLRMWRGGGGREENGVDLRMSGENQKRDVVNRWRAEHSGDSVL